MTSFVVKKITRREFYALCERSFSLKELILIWNVSVILKKYKELIKYSMGVPSFYIRKEYTSLDTAFEFY